MGHLLDKILFLVHLRVSTAGWKVRGKNSYQWEKRMNSIIYFRVTDFKKWERDWGVPLIECVLNMCKVLGSIPSTKNSNR
jgi:hypothetical protein